MPDGRGEYRGGPVASMCLSTVFRLHPSRRAMATVASPCPHSSRIRAHSSMVSKVSALQGGGGHRRRDVQFSRRRLLRIHDELLSVLEAVHTGREIPDGAARPGLFGILIHTTYEYGPLRPHHRQPRSP